MRSHCSWLEAANAESLHFCLLCQKFFLRVRKVGDLVDINCATLQAGTAVNVKLETALDVPLYLLAEPALNEAGTHFKTYDFVLELHQVVKHRNVAWFVDPVE